MAMVPGWDTNCQGSYPGEDGRPRRCLWRLHPDLVAAGYDRHPTCVPDGEPWLPAETAARVRAEAAAAAEADLASRLAELRRLVAESLSAREWAMTWWPERFTREQIDEQAAARRRRIEQASHA
jgi:hypothetical protein